MITVNIVNDTLATRMAQSHAASAVSETLNRDDALPLMESTSAEVMSETFEIASKFLRPSIEDRAPLSFDQIPGPMIMKLWEKYWKYVPIFGTQLFSSLLINRFSQGMIRRKFEAWWRLDRKTPFFFAIDIIYYHSLHFSRDKFAIVRSKEVRSQ